MFPEIISPMEFDGILFLILWGVLTHRSIKQLDLDKK